MRHSILALALFASGVCSLQAANLLIFPRDSNACKTKTTVFEQLCVPNPANPEEVKGLGPLVDLKLVCWREGGFCDDAGRCWKLARGLPYSMRADVIKGWFVKSDLGVDYFLADNGGLYAQNLCSTAPLPTRPRSSCARR